MFEHKVVIEIPSLVEQNDVRFWRLSKPSWGGVKGNDSPNPSLIDISQFQLTSSVNVCTLLLHSGYALSYIDRRYQISRNTVKFP